MSITDDWTDRDWRDWLDGANGSARASLVRACDELEAIADALDELPLRLQRKLWRRDSDNRLVPDIIRNEAERGRDTLAVYTLERER